MSDDELDRKIRNHLSDLRDLTLLVLKSHLLIEEQINWTLREVMPNAAALDDGRFTFYQRVQVLRAINRVDRMDKTLDFAERLNRIRNMLAHKLEPTGIDDEVKTFVTDFAASMAMKTFNVTAPTNHQLTLCVSYICGAIHSFGECIRLVQVEAASQSIKAPLPSSSGS